MRLKLLLLLSCCPFLVKAQNVKLQVAGTWVNLSEEEMQTEIKPGWTIAGKKLKDTQVVYLWGKSSHQISDDSQPGLESFQARMKHWLTILLFA